MRTDFLGLQAFLSIAERGSFHRAATHLNLSQTALSHRIRKLEDSLGTALLVRTTRQVSLTPAGVELLPKARRLIEEIGLALDAVRSQAREAGGRVTIGCLPTIAMMCLPSVLARFAELHPDTVVKVHDNSATEIADRVQAGEAEFGITIATAGRWDLDLSPIVEEPFVLVCRKDMPLAGERALTWAQLEGLPLVRISAETGNRILIDDALGSRRESLSWRYEVQRVTSAVSLVGSGIGYAIVPKMAFDLVGDAALVALPLKSPAVTRTLGVVTRKGWPLSGSAATLLDLTGASLKATVDR